MATALVLTTSGMNCDRELVHAFELAGATAELVHLNRILADPKMIDRYDLIGLPGGFSYGDAVAAGRIAATLMRETLYPAFVAAVARGVPIIAPCNGFQIAVQMGLLPGPAVGEPWSAASPRPTVALATNDTARFVDRWCNVEIPAGTRCIWTQGIDPDETAAVLPVAHGEGRFTVASGDLLNRLDTDGQIAVRYRAGDNPNGSLGDVAGICDATGLVLGLMPHPERFTRWTQHPQWTRLDRGRFERPPLGLSIFRNAVAWAGPRRIPSRCLPGRRRAGDGRSSSAPKLTE
ncbi:MAG: phosphoribosylformylglycinamidine synthase subunit PurQ [Planctomycetota bacterium]|nr:MAG: phosphoribosylformylglycinamidine synthase subunit PurQ [Planctomycetota bacterium]